ncbi:MAG: hypothetical protein NC224_03505 [Bacteroides sp.]|nr:hypothetical protein [Bacteroides sp.]
MSDSTAVFKTRILSRPIEQSERLKDTQNSLQTHLFSPKVPKKPKLQGAENFFARRTSFLRKVNEIYFQGEQNFQSPLFGLKSDISESGSEFVYVKRLLKQNRKTWHNEGEKCAF